ncbi:Protein Wnt-11b, partial [Opisthocomus hoazin]
HCRLLAGLVPDQFQMCRRNLEVMPSIVRAARQTQSICQKTFADMRWNCSSVQRAPRFGPDLLKGPRESAFVYALAAAAEATKWLKQSVCRDIPPLLPSPDTPAPFPQPAQGVCHFTPVLPVLLSVPLGKQRPVLLCSPALRRAARTRKQKQIPLFSCALQVVSDSLDTKCKCHGVSGSCSVKTCWKGLPDLEEIASDLKSKYLAAIKVTHRLVGPRKQLIPKETDVRPVRETDLVYLINSPDYCTPNLHLGSLGTQDRKGNASSPCKPLGAACRGRGYNTYTEEVVERCHCKYHWCCYVVCKKCRRKVERHVCK